jgi:hypothetical protein
MDKDVKRNLLAGGHKLKWVNNQGFSDITGLVGYCPMDGNFRDQSGIISAKLN